MHFVGLYNFSYWIILFLFKILNSRYLLVSPGVSYIPAGGHIELCRTFRSNYGTVSVVVSVWSVSGGK